jgi:hypothetical protein
MEKRRQSLKKFHRLYRKGFFKWKSHLETFRSNLNKILSEPPLNQIEGPILPSSIGKTMVFKRYEK